MQLLLIPWQKCEPQQIYIEMCSHKGLKIILLNTRNYFFLLNTFDDAHCLTYEWTHLCICLSFGFSKYLQQDMLYKADNRHFLSQKQYFLWHCFLDICFWIFKRWSYLMQSLIRRKLPIWSHLLKKFLIENLFLYSVK